MANQNGTEKPRLSAFQQPVLKQIPLNRTLAVAFGFMCSIPILLLVWISYNVLTPYIPPIIMQALQVFIICIVGSMYVGYSVLRRAMYKIVEVVNQAKAISDQQQAGEAAERAEGDEIGELARTFNRVTQELERKIDELESSKALIKRLLSRIGTAIVSYQGIDNLLELIIENASVALEAQMGTLMLVNGEAQELQVKTNWLGTSFRAERATLKFGEGIAGWVAKEQLSMRGNGSPSAIGLISRQVKEGAVLCVPLRIHDHTIGVIAVLREDSQKVFTEDDEILLANIASQVAVAIENYRLNLDVERTYLETVMALAMAVEAKDPYSAGHSKRVAYYAVQIAEAMNVDEDVKRMLKDGGLLHDVGKIGIKDEVLLKPGPLTPEEWRIMQQHSVIGEAILKPLHSMGKVAELVKHHHERFDGGGYPAGLKGDGIPLAARILTVADSYDSMSTDRPYRKRLSIEMIMEELRKGSGTQFDPHVVDAFIGILQQRRHRFVVPEV